MADLSPWAVIVPGVVTPTVVAGYALFQWWLTHKIAQRTELRELLDSAAQELRTAHVAIQKLRREWVTGADFGAERSTRLRDDGWDALHDLNVAFDRIVMRLGQTSQVAQAYFVAIDTTSKWYFQLYERWSRGDSYPGEPSIGEEKERSSIARSGFLAAAKELVGIDVVRHPSPLWPRLPLPPGRET